VSDKARRSIHIALIGLVSVLTYGLLISHLGFYRDDWYLFATAQSEGTAGIIALFQIDRPLIGYLYAIAYRVLDFSPIAWHGTTLGLRVLGNLAFWWLLRLLWPQRELEALSAALLFSVYPGYSVQPNAGVYSTDLAANAAALASIILTIKAMASKNRAATVGLVVCAGLLQIFYLGIFESAIGLEIVRFAIVYYAVWKRHREGALRLLARALRTDLPYLILGIGFVFWRVFLFQSTRRATNLEVLVGQYGAMPLRSALSVGIELLKDVVETTVLAWTVPFYQFVSSSGYRDLLLAMVAGSVVSLLFLMAARAVHGAHATQFSDGRSSDYEHMLALGALMAMFALLPIDLAGRDVLFTDQWDRYTIYASSGAALLLAGTVFRFVHPSARRLALAALLGMSVVVHVLSAAGYRNFWMWQRDLWQQLTWRAPGLKAGTMLFAALPVGGYQEGYEIYGPANMIYYPGETLKIGGDVINASTATALQLQKNRQHYDRSVLVEDNYRNALFAVFPGTDSCLHVLDGRKVELSGLVEDSLITDVAEYSHINMIDTTSAPANLPPFLAGHATRPWCHYYQQMGLARQRADWDAVARLADEALARDLTPEDVSEWMPALEAYATLGREKDMRRAAAIIRSVDSARAFLCIQMQRGATYPAPYDYNLVNQVLCQAG
jgi:hypothetical protein